MRLIPGCVRKEMADWAFKGVCLAVGLVIGVVLGGCAS